MDLYRSKHSDKKYPNRNSSFNDRPSRSFRNSRDNDREDTTVTCADCGDQCTVPFVPRSDKPVYCSDCFRKNKPNSNDDRGSRYSRDDRGSRYSRDDRGSRYSRDDRGSRNSRDDRGSRNSRDNDREDTTVTCADCGDQCTVPFVPRSDKPVYCSDCFRKYKPDDSGNDRPSRDDRGSRYSRDDRGSRYSRDDRGSRNSRDNDREDTTVTCADCGDQCTVPFVPRSDKPVYCSDCFRKYKPDDSGNDRPSRDDRGSRYSRDDRGSRNSRDNDREDTTVTCADCGDQCTVPFVPRSDKPVYCSDCFRKYKPDDSGNDRPSRDDRGSRYSRDDRGSRYSRDDRGSRNSRDNDREDTTVTCADCGDQCTVPFVPRSDKPVYCSDCFRKYKPDDSGNDRPSRDDRGSRYSRDDRGSRNSRDNSRPSRGRSDKLLRKQESFYSGGSAKFNESLQKKLYEILGGKICSSCGSNDERSLGICDTNGNHLSGDTRRGSKAASWGKYISAPNIAKNELKVFCSNCNDAVVPTPKPQEERPRSKSKRSKYFPR